MCVSELRIQMTLVLVGGKTGKEFREILQNIYTHARTSEEPAKPHNKQPVKMEG